MRYSNNLLILIISICLISSRYCVDRTRFKTCDQLDFCKDLLSLKGNHKRFELIPNSQKCDDNNNGIIEASYINIEDIDDIKSKIKIQITKNDINGKIARIKVTEIDPTYHRLDVFHDLLQGIQNEPSIVVDRSNTILSTKNECILTLENNTKIHFQYQPILIHISDDDLSYISLNEDGLLQIESHKDSNGRRILNNTNTSTDFLSKVPKGRRAISLDVHFRGFSELYGLPEHTDSFAMDPTKNQLYRLYNLDVFEYEINERMALYGAVPFVHAHGLTKSMGIFWNNVAETWIDLKPINKPKFVIFNKDTGQRRLHFISESGIIDLFVMIGPTPHMVSQQFSTIVGYQQLPPLTSLGFHQCRWNYMTQQETIEVVQKFDEYNIPLDYVWLDIEHADQKKYFTWDPSRFNNPELMIKSISSLGRRLVTIVDPHIAARSDYVVYNDAINADDDLLVKNSDGSRFNGWCWPGNSVYSDFVNPKTREWFSNYFNFSFYNGSTTDVHIWIDMNEPSVFSGPEITLPKDTLHYGNWENRDIHNIYGFLYHETVYQGLLKRTNGLKRPFILTRSFYAGSQKYGAIWNGDNFANWEHLRISIPMLLSLSISGIHFVGADVGGFFGHPSKELYIRWIQAASMTPFMRSHAHLDSPRREPWVFGDDCLDITRTAITRRYTYLPYIYFTFYESHKYAKPIMKPLWFNFPNDISTFKLESSYMIGDALLAIPVLKQHDTFVDAYFPTISNNITTIWYDTETYQHFNGGTTYKINAPLNKFPLFQKHGTIVPRWMRKRRSASLMKNDPLTLVIILDDKNYADGYLYMDDGDTTDHYINEEYLLVRFTFNNNTLNSTIIHHNTKNAPIDNTIERIIIVAYNQPNMLSSLRYIINNDADVINTVEPLETTENPTIIPNGFVIRKPQLNVGNEFEIRFL